MLFRSPDSIAIGLTQCLAAVFPGLSRSGSTMSVGLMRGVNQQTALDYSFVLGIPSIAAAALVSLKDVGSAGEAIGGFASTVGGIVGGFFTETIPTFLTEQVPYAVGYVVGAAQVFFTETIPAKVGELLTTVGTFFTETLPTWAEGVAQRATTFFTETVPATVGNLLQNVGSFFKIGRAHV